MIEKTLSEFLGNAERLTASAITNDDFVKIKTNVGNAVLISEAEWNILIDGMKTLIAGNNLKL